MRFVMKRFDDLLEGMCPDGAAAWSGGRTRVRKPGMVKLIELRPANDGGRRVVVIVPGSVGCVGGVRRVA